ncbi:MAG: thiamine pyrophosphate-binding protein [Rhodospirillales bacterium]|jgi:acetolactate synthase-1/2/3 large subunit|nr:thiamine pyrophosphate-binding protein [Rhodospirillales bacterium]
MNTAEVITEYLSAVGIRHVFGYPGDPNVEFLEVARKAGLEFVLARREGTAGLMAEAYGQLTGRPGVCMSTLGPGSSNLVNAVANAYLDRAPMLALSGQIEGRREATFTHQVLDHNRLFSPISKWTAKLRPDNVGAVLRKALRTAVAERPGPVHLTVPADVVGAEALDSEIRLPPMEPVIGAAQVFASSGALADPAKRLKRARKPVIVAGISAVRAGATDALAALAADAGIPVVVAPMAKGVIPEDHAYYAGTLDMACSAYVWDFLKACDLILCVGFDAVELIKPWTPAAPVIHVDSTPNTDQIYAAEIEVVGSIPHILEDIRQSVNGRPKWPRARVRTHREGLRKLYYAGRVAGALNPTDVIDAVRAAMPAEAVVTTDVGSHKLLVGQGWTAYGPRTVLMTNGLSSMGYALPASISAKLLLGAAPVVCFTGDGGLAMVQGELRLAASLGLALVVVVFRDDSLNRIELKQMARQYPSFGTRFDATDTEALARSMGCDGIEVDDARGLESALAAPRAADRPLVIGAKIDPTQYAAQF